MPCYEVNLMTVEFNVKNIDILKEAIKKLGFQTLTNDRNSNIVFLDESYNEYKIDMVNNVIETRSGNNDIINKVKRTYSAVAIEKAAKKNKWAIRNTAAYQYKAIKY